MYIFAVVLKPNTGVDLNILIVLMMCILIEKEYSFYNTASSSEMKGIMFNFVNQKFEFP